MPVQKRSGLTELRAKDKQVETVKTLPVLQGSHAGRLAGRLRIRRPTGAFHIPLRILFATQGQRDFRGHIIDFVLTPRVT